MNNDVVFKTLQQSYDSLLAFNVQNNVLYYNYNGVTYQLPLSIVNFNSISPDIFLLKPEDIWRALYLIELLNKDNLTANDEEFVAQYTEKYLRLEQKRIEHSENDETDIDERYIAGLGIPIAMAKYPEFAEKRVCKIIDEIEYKRIEEIESGNYKGQKLVRINPNVPKEYTLPDELSDLGKAGFTTLITILSAVVLTGLYIAYFIIGK